MTLSEIRDQVVDLQRELAEEYHRAGAGLQEGLDTTTILDRYAALATADARAVVAGALRAAEDETERQRLLLLREQVAWIYDAHRGRELTDELDRAEAAAEVEVDGDRLPYRAVHVHLVNEPDRGRRQRLANARDTVLTSLHPLQLRQFELAQAVARELGYANHTARCAELGALPLDDLAGVMRSLLAETEGLYAAVLPPALAQQGVALDEATWADLARLFRVTGWDAEFPADQLLPRVLGMVEAMGLDPYAGGHVSFDLDERPLKSSRPFCSVLEAPERVVLVLRPVGGLSDYAAFLHELGHALHFGHVDPELPWEFRHLGDNSITEAYAFLFDRLTVDAVWLSDVAGLADPAPLARLLALRELMMLRKYAAQLLYELDLFAGDDPRPMQSAYVERLSRATGVRHSPAAWLSSVDPLYYSARYLQGWLFEAVLRERLVSECGPRWFRHPHAGERLRALYRRGQDRPVADLFGELGARPLAIDPLLRRMRAELG